MQNYQRSQKALIQNLAKKYDLNPERVSSLLAMMGKFTVEKMGEIQKGEDNLFDPETALTIHITLFGKFIPRKARMNKVRQTMATLKKKNAIKKNGNI